MKAISSIIASAVIVAGSAAAATAPIVAANAEAPVAAQETAVADEATSIADLCSGIVRVANAHGTFSFVQDKLSSNEAIAGVFTEYVGQQVLMSNELYEEVFNETPQYNTLLVNQNGSDCTEAVERISGLNGFISSRDTVERYNHAKALSSVLDYG